MNTHFAMLLDYTVIKVDTHKFTTPYKDTKHYWGAFYKEYFEHGPSEEIVVNNLIAKINNSLKEKCANLFIDNTKF